MIENTPLHSRSSADNNSCVKSGRTWLLGMLLLLLFPLSSFGASITFDFRKLYTEEAREDISGTDLLKYLDSEEVSPGLVQAIPYCNQAYAYSNGLKKISGYKDYITKLTDFGALFIQAVDPETKQDTGGVTIQIAPKYRHRNTNLNIFVYKDDNNLGSGDNIFTPLLEVSLNGGPYQKAEITKADYASCTFNIKPNDTIIKDLSIRIPNPARNKDGELLADTYIPYFLALTHINLYYNEDTPEKVIDWRFAETSHIGYLNDEKPYMMPPLTAIPSAAADMMELSSSDPAVADIVEGKVSLKGEGSAVITASLPENSLFIPGDSYAPATYELTVKNSMSTAIELVEADTISEATEMYDLQGRRITGKPVPGIYILRTGFATSKVIIR